MKKIYLLLLAVWGYTPLVCGQSDEQVIGYFGKNWIPITDSKRNAEIAYYRTAEFVPGCCFLVRDYDTSNRLRMQAECSSFIPSVIRDGKAVFYHENGKLDNESVFKNDKRVGIVRYFYDTGMLKEELEYIGDTIRCLQSFSPAGVSVLVQGNAVTSSQTPEGIVYREYKDHIAVAEFRIINDNDTIYTTLDSKPEFEGGYEAAMQILAKNIKYPAEARKHKQEGTVHISFIISKSGNAENFQVAEGFDKHCNAEALRVVSLLKKWIPGKHKNKPVTTQLSMPVRFKLGT